jgi:hypothetical protein
MNVTLCFLQISSVASVENESTTTISSAIPSKDERQLSINNSSLYVIITADILGIHWCKLGLCSNLKQNQLVTIF